MPDDSQALQRLERAERLARKQLDQNLAEETRLLTEQGILRNRLQKIAIHKYKLLTGQRR